MIRSMAFVALAFATGASAMHRDPPATDEEKQAAIRLYIDCIETKIVDLDDGISDALTVGSAAAQQCRPALAESVKRFARGENRYVQNKLYDLRVSQEASEGAAAVLARRRRLAQHTP